MSTQNTSTLKDEPLGPGPGPRSTHRKPAAPRPADPVTWATSRPSGQARQGNSRLDAGHAPLRRRAGPARKAVAVPHRRSRGGRRIDRGAPGGCRAPRDGAGAAAKRRAAARGRAPHRQRGRDQRAAAGGRDRGRAHLRLRRDRAGGEVRAISDGAMADIEPAVKPPAVIIPFLNGMAHVEALTGRFGSAVLGGVLRIATKLEDDGTIRVLTPEFDVELGELDGSPSTRVDRLASAFKDAGADVTVPGNIVDAMWAKWVFIASLGAVTSLMRAPVGAIAAVPAGQRFAQSVLAEAAAAAAACGHPVPAGQLHADRAGPHRPGVAGHIVADPRPDRGPPHRGRGGAGRPRRARPRGRDRHPADRPGRAGPADPQPADRILSTAVCRFPCHGLSFDYARPAAAALIDQAIPRRRCLKPATSRRNLRCPCPTP